MGNVGDYDVRKVAITGEEALYQRYLIRFLELIEEYLHYLRENSESARQRNVSQITTIYDGVGFNLKTGACLQCKSAVS